jgi:ribosomal protein S18 acetylase RimI-like enzyme
VTRVEIVEVEDFEQLLSLQAFTEQIFEAGPRTSGWFRRKLIREGVQARLSAIAIEPGSKKICGCVLVGEAVSLRERVRGSTVAVATAVRGRGVGRALIDFADALAHARGFEQLEFLCEDERLGWYLQQGFTIVERQLLLSTSGLGPRDDLQTKVATEAAAFGSDPLWTWLPETWTRTPLAERAYLELDVPGGKLAKIWLTHEGRAWLASRLEIDPLSTRAHVDLVNIVGQLRHAIARDTPLLLYPCTAGTPTAEALVSAGSVPLQRSFLVRRPTGSQPAR